MNEDIIFGAELQDDGLTLGLEKLESVLGDLDKLGKQVGDSLASGLGSVFDALANLDKISVDTTGSADNLARQLGLVGDNARLTQEQIARLADIFRGANELLLQFSRDAGLPGDSLKELSDRTELVIGAIEALLPKLVDNREVVRELNGATLDLTASFGQLFPEAVSKIVGTIDGLLPKLVDNREVVRELQGATLDLTATFGQMFPEAATAVTNAIEKLLPKLVDNREVVRELNGATLDATATFGQLFPEAATSVANSIDKLLPKLVDAREATNALHGTTLESVVGFNTLFPEAVNTAASALDKLLPKLVDDREVVETLYNAALKLTGTFGELFPEAATAVTNAIEKLLPKLVDNREVVRELNGATLDATASFGQLFPEAVSATVGAISNLLPKLVDNREVVRELNGATLDLTAGFGQLFPEATSAAASAISNLLPKLVDNREVVRELQGATLDLTASFSQLFPEAASAAAGAMDKLLPKLVDDREVTRELNGATLDLTTSFSRLFPESMNLAASAATHLAEILESGGVQALKDLGFEVVETADKGNIFTRALDFMRAQAESLLAQLRALGEQLGIVGGDAEGAGLKFLGMGEKSNEARSMMSNLAGGVGEFIAIMAGFAVVNEAGRALHDFGNWAFEGNIQLEKFTQELTVLVGGAAKGIVDWSFQFGRTIPFTTQALQQAILTVASMGQNVEQVLPVLADMAAATGADLPQAATAFFDAFKEHRFLMLMTQLRVSKTDLEAFGLQVAKDGSIVESTFLPALEKLEQKKFPGALNTAMHTFYGETSNLVDQMQQLAMAFGNPIFKTYEGLLFDLTVYLQQNHEAIAKVAQEVGGVFAVVLQFLAGILKDVLGFLLQHHSALAALAGLIAGSVIGVLVGLAGWFGSMLVTLSPLLGLFLLAGAAIGAMGAAFKKAYDESPGLRQALKDLGSSLGELWTALKPLVEGALKNLADLLRNAFQAAATWLGSKPVQQAIHDLAGDIHWLAQELKPVADNAPLVAKGFQPMEQAAHNVVPLFRDLRQFVKDVADHFGQLLPGLLGVGTVIGVLATGGLPAVVGYFWTFANALIRMPVSLIASLPGLFNGITSVFENLTPAVLGFFDNLGPLLSGGFATLLSNLGTWIGGAVAGFQALLPVITAVGVPLLVIAAVVAGVVLAFQHWWTTSAGFRAMIMQVGTELGKLWSIIQSSLKPVLDQLGKTMHDSLLPAWKSLQDAFEAAKPLLILIGTVVIGLIIISLGILVAVLRGVFTALGPFLAGIIQVFGGLVQIIAGVISFIVSAVMGFAQIFYDIITGHFDKVGKDGQAALDRMARAIQNIWEGIKNVAAGLWKSIVDTVVGFVKGLWEGVVSWFQNLYDKLVGHSIIPDLVNKIIEWFKSLPGKAADALSTLVSKITQPFTDVMNKAGEWGKEIVQHLIDGLSNMLGNLEGAAKNVANAISKYLHFSLPDEGPLVDVDKWMPDFADELISGMDSRTSDLEAAAGRMAIAITRPLRGSGSGISPSAAASALSLGLPGVNATGASTGGGSFGGGGDVHAHIHLEGDARFGLDLLDPVARENIFRQMARDWADSVKLQGILPSGYTGAN